jgi:hypothetical protein
VVGCLNNVEYLLWGGSKVGFSEICDFTNKFRFERVKGENFKKK